MPFIGWLYLIYAVTHVVSGCITAARADICKTKKGFSYLNPKVIHKSIKVNWFGAIFIAIIHNALLPVFALVYWLYKLCTFGRNDNT